MKTTTQTHYTWTETFYTDYGIFKTLCMTCVLKKTKIKTLWILRFPLDFAKNLVSGRSRRPAL